MPILMASVHAGSHYTFMGEAGSSHGSDQPRSSASAAGDGLPCGPPGVAEHPDREDTVPGTPVAVISFDSDWTWQVSTLPERGGAAVIDYDLSRLPQCRGDTYMGVATWNILAHIKFDTRPVQSLSVLGCNDRACTAPYSVPVTVAVPEDASRLELWFSVSGRTCGVHWDSNYGRNYQVPVKPRVSPTSSPLI